MRTNKKDKKYCLIAQPPVSEQVAALAQRWGFVLTVKLEGDDLMLEWCNGKLQLFGSFVSRRAPFYVDFCKGRMGYRRKFGGGTKEAVAKAVGIKPGVRPSVVDATAGWGRDAFVLASIGCRVHMMERHPVVAALLEDGLLRAKLTPEVGQWIDERMSLVCIPSERGLKKLPITPDVIYLDPMFPQKKKSALVKKEMRVLQSLVFPDGDAAKLLKIARSYALKRVVVKRPAYAEYLSEEKPDVSIKTPNHRFDVYLTGQSN